MQNDEPPLRFSISTTERLNNEIHKLLVGLILGAQRQEDPMITHSRSAGGLYALD
jgi:hypothetical protein